MNAFDQCSALTSVSLPKATSIGNRAFYDCRTLTSVCLPKATTIGDRAFQFCDRLTTLFLSNCPETEFDASDYSRNPNYGNRNWEHIHYGYKGTDGDYLNPDNYTGHWPETTN